MTKIMIEYCRMCEAMLHMSLVQNAPYYTISTARENKANAFYSTDL